MERSYIFVPTSSALDAYEMGVFESDRSAEYALRCYLEKQRKEKISLMDLRGCLYSKDRFPVANYDTALLVGRVSFVVRTRKMRAHLHYERCSAVRESFWR